MSAMSVLHLINTGGPGGAETVYVNLVRNLDPARFRPVAISPNREWMYDQLVELGVEPILLRSHARLDRRYLLGLARIIRERKVRLIHSHLFGPSVTASMLGLACGVPVISTLHGEGDLSPNESFRRLKFGLLRRGADRVVCVSEPLRRFFLDAGDLAPERTVVVPNGIDPAFFASHDRAVRSELGIGEDEFLVGAVGNLRTAKGYDVLLRAAALLRARSPGYRFAIVGQAQGELYDELLRLRAELGLTETVHFAGFRDDVPRTMAAFDLFTISSRSEGFSLSTVQAMGAGLPVVATRCGGPEMILDDGTTGLLVDVESPEQLADAIARLRADEPQRRRLAAAGREVALRRYTLEEQVRRYESLYDECIGAPAPRRTTARVLASRT